jgi:hypothetical protein
MAPADPDLADLRAYRRVHSGVELLLDGFGGGRPGTRRRTCRFALGLLRAQPWAAFPMGEPKRMTLPSGSATAPSCWPHSVSCGE